MSGATRTLGASPRIAVLGVGAVGSVVGGLLADGGHDVTLIDQWPENVELIQANGLGLSGTCGDRQVAVPALHIHQLQSVTVPFDVVLLAVKSYDTDWATTLAARYLADDGVVVTLQNGINDPRVAAIVGERRTMGCVTLIGVAMDGPGAAMKTDSDSLGFKIGELDGAETERARRLVEIFSSVAPGVVTSNLWGERWSKLALNCMVNPLAAVSGLGAADVRSNPHTQQIGVCLGAEAISVGRASGHEVEAVFRIEPERIVAASRGEGLAEVMATIGDGAAVRGNGWPSMLQDVRKQRRSEVDQLNGFVASEGRRLGIETPLNDAIVDTFAELGTAFEPDVSRLAPLLELSETRVAVSR
ncbi:MAG: 2-dehydropantoate 2-reductase [Conexibacter sp.]|nr:2-dehydropantoate 2-reductase [Conexibacter sp.]